MNVALWIVASILALANLFSGGTKLSQPKDQLAQRGMAFVEDFTATQVKLIGLAEVLGALGLILPQATGIAPVLTPIAAVGIVIIQAGAIVVHLRRNEAKVVPANAVLLLTALFVAVGRFVTG